MKEFQLVEGLSIQETIFFRGIQFVNERKSMKEMNIQKSIDLKDFY
jgi:hypothetical protein